MLNQNQAFGGAHTLITHLLTSPNLAEQLNIVHDLALYDSGDALLGEIEKDALFSIKQLAERITRIGRKERKQLQKLLR